MFGEQNNAYGTYYSGVTRGGFYWSDSTDAGYQASQSWRLYPAAGHPSITISGRYVLVGYAVRCWQVDVMLVQYISALCVKEMCSNVWMR
jgi:hypothetical protein